MISQCEQNHVALEVLLIRVLPAAVVVRNQAKPDDITADGYINLVDGQPNEIGVDLSPPTYNYEDEIPCNVAIAPPADGTSAGQALAPLLSPIGQAIAADPTLGGLVDYVRVTAATSYTAEGEGTDVYFGADFAFVVTYSTRSPLG